MRLFFLIAACFTPAGIWGVYANRKKLPLLLLAAAFFTALLAVVSTLLLQWLYAQWIPPSGTITQTVIRSSFIDSALIEETVKMIAVMVLTSTVSGAVFRRGRGGEPAVGVCQLCILAVFFGLLFGGFETLSYSLRYPRVLPLRIITAVLLHGSLAVLFVPVMRKKSRRITNFFRAVLLHGLYNMFFLFGGFFIVPGITVLVSAVLHAAGIVRCTQ